MACIQTNAMFFVPQAIPTLTSTKEMTPKENVSHLITEQNHAEQLQQNPPNTLKMALYPVRNEMETLKHRLSVVYANLSLD